MMHTQVSNFFRFIMKKHNNVVYNYIDDIIRLEKTPLALDAFTY